MVEVSKFVHGECGAFRLRRTYPFSPPSDLCFAEEDRVVRAISATACGVASSVGGAEGTYSSINVI